MPEAAASAVLEFGSRSGSYTALALFGTMFAALAYGVLREIRRRAPQRRGTAWIVAALLFAGPLTLVYATSLSGFYEAEIRGGRLVFHYLHPLTTEISLADVTRVRASPAFKSLWRLHVTDASGVERVSATSSRYVISAAADRLRPLTGR